MSIIDGGRPDPEPFRSGTWRGGVFSSDFWTSVEPTQWVPGQFGALSSSYWATPLKVLPPIGLAPIATRAGQSAAASAAAAPDSQVLYLQQTGTSTPISVADINQGGMADCFVLSPIGELALFHPDWLSQMIQANPDGTETVTLYRAANGGLPTVGSAFYTPVAIDVTNTFPTNSVNNRPYQDELNGQKEIWVQVLEKAVATLCGGYDAISNGGIPSIAMEELTGCTAYSGPPAAVSQQRLQSAISAGDLINFDTPVSSTLPYGLYSDHAYMFVSLSSADGVVMVNLHNPWGFNDPDPIPFSQIGTVCSEIDIDHFTKTVGPGPALVRQTPNQFWAQGSQVSLTLPAGVFVDRSGLSMTYTATQANGEACPTWLTFNQLTRTFSGTVPSGSETLTLKVTATDTASLSCSETFTATVPGAAPVLTHQTAAQIWTEGTALSFTLPSNTFTDPSGQTLSYSATLANGLALPSWLTVNAATGAFSGTVGFTAGALAIKLTATDTGGLSADETLQITLAPPPPIVTDHTARQTWTANQAVALPVAAAFTDPQGESLTYTAALSNGKPLPSGLTFNTATATFGGIAPTALGALAITVTAKDASGLSASETIQCSVTARAPVVAHPTAALTWTAGKPVTAALPSNTFADPQSEAMKYAATRADGSPLPAGLSFNATTEAFSGTAPITPQTLGLKVTATDASGLSVSEAVSVTIQAAAPTVTHQTANQVWNAGASMSFLLPANTFADPQGSALSYAAYETSGPDDTGWLKFAAGQVDLAGAVPSGMAGSIGIRIVATDAYGLSASETFAMTFAAGGAHLAAAFVPTGTEMLALHG